MADFFHQLNSNDDALAQTTLLLTWSQIWTPSDDVSDNTFDLLVSGFWYLKSLNIINQQRQTTFCSESELSEHNTHTHTHTSFYKFQYFHYLHQWKVVLEKKIGKHHKVLLTGLFFPTYSNYTQPSKCSNLQILATVIIRKVRKYFY
jgi:hypothetical protein